MKKQEAVQKDKEIKKEGQRSELKGLLFLAAGLFLLAAYAGLPTGFVGEFFREAMRYGLGLGAILFPLSCIAMGIGYFRVGKNIIRFGWFWAAVLFYVCLLGFLHHIFVPLDYELELSFLPNGGGMIGGALAKLLHSVAGATGSVILLIGGMLAGLVLTGKLSLASLTTKAGDKIQNMREASRARRRDRKLPEPEPEEPAPQKPESDFVVRRTVSTERNGGSMDPYNSKEFSDYNEDIRKDSVFKQILNLGNKKQDKQPVQTGFDDPWPDRVEKDREITPEQMANHKPAEKEKPKLIVVHPEKQETVVLRPANGIINGHRDDPEPAPWEKDAMLPVQEQREIPISHYGDREGAVSSGTEQAAGAPRFELTDFGIRKATEVAASAVATESAAAASVGTATTAATTMPGSVGSVSGTGLKGADASVSAQQEREKKSSSPAENASAVFAEKTETAAGVAIAKETEPDRETGQVTAEEKGAADAGNNTCAREGNNENGVEDETGDGTDKETEAPPPPAYIFPPIELLNPAKIVDQHQFDADVRRQCAILEKTLADFRVNAKVIGVTRGPSVTRYELEPAPGVKVSTVVNLADDIALRLAAPGVRVEAPIPGKAAIGIEAPNITNDMVNFREIVDCDAVRNDSSKLCVGLGKDIEGKVITIDLSKMPHLLIAGTTGSGKSVCVNTLLAGIMYKARPDEVKLILVDPKVVELTNYNGIPHLLVPVVTDPKKAASALHWAVSEMERRYKSFADTHVRDIKAYNAQAVEKMPYIVIVIDEMSDLMMVAKADVEDAILRLAQKARACGIHMVLATQRPSVDVITGIVKANIPSRIAFAVSSLTDSRTILDMGGAEKLLGKGDMLFYPIGANKPSRVQGAFVSDEELNRVTGFIKEQAIPVEYSEEVTSAALPSDSQKEEKASNGTAEAAAAADDGQDELLDEAIRLVLELGQASSSMLQRRFRIGYNRAARLVDTMEELGIVGPAIGSKPRELLLSKEEVEYRFLNKDDFNGEQ